MTAIPVCLINVLRNFYVFTYYTPYTYFTYYLELQDSAKGKGHFVLYNCLVLRHSKYSGIQRVYCNPFLAKPFHGSHHIDLVMILPQGIDNGAFVVTPDSVWYARVLLLFSASAEMDTGSKFLDCALVSTLESYDDPENGNHNNYDYYIH